MGADALVILSPRERQVMALVATGLSNKEIAHRLNLTLGTVKTYVSSCCAHLTLSGRVQLAIWTAAHSAALRGDAVDAAFTLPEFDVQAA